MKNSNPLISFCLIAYNQEQYINASIEGAFSQTYSPLEIILSDDGSSDKTFEIMQEMTANYKGPHKIILNKNQKNIGLAAHFNEVIERAQGDFIVMADGDDISSPERTEIIANDWLNSNYNKQVLYHSGWRNIDAKSVYLSELTEPYYQNAVLNNPIEFLKQGAYALGATLAFPKSLYTYYGPMNTGIYNQDTIMTFRASLLDGIILIKKCLVDYRNGVGLGWVNTTGVSKEAKIKFKLKHARHYYYTYLQHLNDYYKSNYKSDKVEKFIRKGINNKEALMFGFENNFFKVISNLSKFLLKGISFNIAVYISLFSFFKSFGTNRVPNFLLR